MQPITYRAFGAAGDGIQNDIAAIIAAHEYANQNNLPVRADAGATYYISEVGQGAVIRTDTDWTDASFIIDDSAVGLDCRSVSIFTVAPTTARTSVPAQLPSIRRTADRLPLTPPQSSIVVLTDTTTRRYIREGLNANAGAAQTDTVVIDRNGSIDMRAPLIWDFDTVTDAAVLPMDEAPLTLRGGTFTTIANRQESRYNYYNRGIMVNRANVVVEDIAHFVEGEGEHGAPYNGFLSIHSCANVTVRRCTFTARRTYSTIGAIGKPVKMGSYDLLATGVINLTIEHCRQTTDILDTRYWGVMASNSCKNILLRDCIFSRFDAHQGVANVTIEDSTLGHQCLNAIGCGTLRIERSALWGKRFINLRSDYGSTWEGEVIIRDCRWTPNLGRAVGGECAIIGGEYSGYHDFGYPCFMPARITIDGLAIDDTAVEHTVSLLGNITPAHVNAAYEADVAAHGYPYHTPQTVHVCRLACASGGAWTLSENPFMYRGVTVIAE